MALSGGDHPTHSVMAIRQDEIGFEVNSTGRPITTSKFAPACYKFVEDKPMTLIDGNELLDLFQKNTDLKVRILCPPKST